MCHALPAFVCRKAQLPLVNKRWAQALRVPSHAWRDVYIGPKYGDEHEPEQQDAGKPQNGAKVLVWCMARPG